MRIKLKAKKDAPDTIQTGNLTTEKKDGFYFTDNRDFADAIIADGHATDFAGDDKPKVKKKVKPAAEKETKPATETKPAETVNENSTEGDQK